MNDEVHVGDIGTVIKVRFIDDKTKLPIDISDFTLLVIKVLKPVTGLASLLAVLSGDGTDGYAEFISIADTFSLKGDWKIQGHVEGPGYKNHTRIKEFEVFENLE